MSSTDLFGAVNRDLSMVLGRLLRLPLGRDDGDWLHTPPLLAVRERRTASGVVVMNSARDVPAFSHILVSQAVLKDVHAVSWLEMEIKFRRIRLRDEKNVGSPHSKHLTQTFVSGLLVRGALNEVKVPRFTVWINFSDKGTRRPRSEALLLLWVALRARDALLPKFSRLTGLVTLGQSLHEQLKTDRTQTFLLFLKQCRAHCLRIAKVLRRSGLLKILLVLLKILLAAKGEFGSVPRTFSSDSIARPSGLFIFLGGWLEILAFSL